MPLVDSEATHHRLVVRRLLESTGDVCTLQLILYIEDPPLTKIIVYVRSTRQKSDTLPCFAVRNGHTESSKAIEVRNRALF